MSSPRPPQQRKADALAKLEERHGDLWAASASSTGTAHLVPLSFAWDGGHIIVATQPTATTTRNIVASGRVRLALGGTRDVVIVDAMLFESVSVTDAPTDIAERYANQADWDPRVVAEPLVYLLLRPERIQVWREADEIPDRTIMRDGTWLG